MVGETLTVGEVRAGWQRFAGFDVRTGIALLLVFGVARMAVVFAANAGGSYQAVSVVFVLMAALPWIVLRRAGRRRIGLVRPTSWLRVLAAAVAGAVLCAGVFFAFAALAGRDIGNPFAYIAASYVDMVPADPSDTDLVITFIIFAVIGATFSPIGEEILYRGFAHESLRPRLGSRGATLVEAGAFAVAHLAHFGIVFADGAWMLLPLPALGWLIAMFAAAVVFAAARRLTGSLVGAIACHAAFNVTMTALIFFVLGVR